MRLLARPLRAVRRVGLATAGVLALCSPAAALAAPPPAGAPVQLPPPKGCFAATSVAGCTADPFGSFLRPIAIDVAPDGRDVYVANQSGELGRFRRAATTGALTPAGETTAGTGGLSLQDVRVTADGKFALAAMGNTAGSGRVRSFVRNAATGNLTSAGCVEQGPADPICPDVIGLTDATAVAVPPSGPGVYVAATFGGPDGGDGDTEGDGAIITLALNQTTGALTQLQCIPATTGPAPCAADTVPALYRPQSIAVAPDGAHVYAGGFGGLVGYNRDKVTGQLTSIAACLRRLGGTLTCPQDTRLSNIDAVRVSPDGRFVYAGQNGGVLTVYRREPLSGALTFVQCFRASGSGSTCPVLANFIGAHGIAVSPDSSVVYTAGGAAAEGQVEAFRRNPTSGTLTRLACVGVVSTSSCRAAAGMRIASDVETSRDGRNVYTAAIEGTGAGDLGALSSFAIEAAPVCRSATASVGAGRAVKLQLACADPNGQALVRQITGQPAKGTLGAVDQAAGTVTYRARPKASGTDVVAFRATDGTNVSAPARVTVTIQADRAAPRARVAKVKRVVRRTKLKRFRGTAKDGGSGVARVEVALIRRGSGKRPCSVLKANGKFKRRAARNGKCLPQGFLRASGKGAWTFKLKRRLPPGSYTVYARARDRAGNVERRFSKSRGNLRTLRVKR